MSAGSDLRASALQLLRDFGRSLTLRQTTPGTYNPADGSTSAPPPIDYTGVGRIGDYRDSVIDGQLIRQGDRRCTIILDNSSVLPSVGDTVLIGGTPRYTVVRVQVREVSGVTVVHTLQLRGLGTVLS